MNNIIVLVLMYCVLLQTSAEIPSFKSLTASIRCDSVSYTHLDVYKRQHQSSDDKESHERSSGSERGKQADRRIDIQPAEDEDGKQHNILFICITTAVVAMHSL